MQNTPSEVRVNYHYLREGISDITRVSRCFSGNWGSLWTPWVDGGGGTPALSLLGLQQGFPSRRASFLLAFWPAHGVHWAGSVPSKEGTQGAQVTSPRAATVSVVTLSLCRNQMWGESMSSRPSGIWWPPTSTGHGPKHHHHRCLRCHHPCQCLHGLPVLSALDAAHPLWAWRHVDLTEPRELDSVVPPSWAAAE